MLCTFWSFGPLGAAGRGAALTTGFAGAAGFADIVGGGAGNVIGAGLESIVATGGGGGGAGAGSAFAAAFGVSGELPPIDAMATIATSSAPAAPIAISTGFLRDFVGNGLSSTSIAPTSSAIGGALGNAGGGGADSAAALARAWMAKRSMTPESSLSMTDEACKIHVVDSL